MRTRKLIIAGILLFLVVPVFGQRGRYQGPPSIADIKWNNAISVSPTDYAGYGSLQAVCDGLASGSYDGRMGALTADNRRSLLLTPGVYGGISASLTLPAHVDLIGIGGMYAVVLNMGAYTILNASTANDTNSAITNVISGMTINGQVYWSNGSAVANLIIHDCRIVGNVYAFLEDGSVSIWNSTITTSAYSAWTLWVNPVHIRGGLFEAYNCVIDSYGIASYARGYGYAVNLNGYYEDTEANLYNCQIYSSNIREDTSTTAGYIVSGSGTLNIYGGTIISIANTGSSGEAATAYGAVLHGESTGSLNAYNVVVLTTTATTTGTAVEYDYYKITGATGDITLGGSFGDDTNTDNVIITPTIIKTIACTSATDIADYPNGSTFSNEGASGSVAFTMPAAVKGARVSIADVVATAGADITVTCAGTDVFIDPDDGTTTYTVYSHTADLWGFVGWECYTDGYWQMQFSLGATE